MLPLSVYISGYITVNMDRWWRQFIL